MTELFEFLGTYWWILIVLIVFVYSAFEEWLKFKTEQRKIGASAEEMEAELDALRSEWDAERKRLNQRIQNLETIVTSEAWDTAMQGSAQSSVQDSAQTEAQNAMEDEAPLRDALLDEEDSAQGSTQQEDKAARLARRLRNR